MVKKAFIKINSENSPWLILAATGAFCLVVLLISINILLQQAWLGISWDLERSANGLRVKSIHSESPAINQLKVGGIITGLKTEDQLIELNSQIFLPSFFHRTHAEYQKNIKTQNLLFQALNSRKSIILIDNQQINYIIKPASKRPLNSLSISFWVFALIFFIVPLTGVMVYIYKCKLLVAKILFLASLNYYVFFMLDNAYFNKELVFHPMVTSAFDYAAIIALVFYIIFLTLIFFVYPNDIISKKWVVLFLIYMSFYPLNFYGQWLDLWINNFLWHSFPPFLLAIILSQYQIHKSYAQTLQRTSARILQFAMVAPFLPSMLLYVLPVALKQPPLITPDITRILSLLVFMGLALAILRYRLFDMESWWFKSWVWLMSGLVLALVDFLLISWLHIYETYALGLSVVITGLIYFPLRQWLLGKIIPLDQQTIQDFLPIFNKLMTTARNQAEFEKNWQLILLKRFQPLHLETQLGKLEQSRLMDNGLCLDVPSLDREVFLRLSGKQNGLRLFSSANVTMANGLLELARIASRASERRLQVMAQERSRIMHDLHDTLGAKLLTLSYKLPNLKQQQIARDALQNLRQLISLSSQTTPILLSICAADWRADLVEQLDNPDIRLNWQLAPELVEQELIPRQVIEIGSFLKNALQQSLVEATLRQIDVVFSKSKTNQLVVSYSSSPPTMSQSYNTLLETSVIQMGEAK